MPDTDRVTRGSPSENVLHTNSLKLKVDVGKIEFEKGLERFSPTVFLTRTFFYGNVFSPTDRVKSEPMSGTSAFHFGAGHDDFIIPPDDRHHLTIEFV